MTNIKRFGDPLVLLLTMGFILLFLGASLIQIDWTAKLIADGFAWTADALGSFFQLLLLMTFLVGIGVAISPAGSAKVGRIIQICSHFFVSVVYRYGDLKPLV